MGPFLTAVDLLEGQDVGVEGHDRPGEAVEVHLAVVGARSVQDVERHQAHVVRLSTGGGRRGTCGGTRWVG